MTNEIAIRRDAHRHLVPIRDRCLLRVIIEAVFLDELKTHGFTIIERHADQHADRLDRSLLLQKSEDLVLPLVKKRPASFQGGDWSSGHYEKLDRKSTRLNSSH